RGSDLSSCFFQSGAPQISDQLAARILGAQSGRSDSLPVSFVKGGKMRVGPRHLNIDLSNQQTISDRQHRRKNPLATNAIKPTMSLLLCMAQRRVRVCKTRYSFERL